MLFVPPSSLQPSRLPADNKLDVAVSVSCGFKPEQDAQLVEWAHTLASRASRTVSDLTSADLKLKSADASR